VKSPTRLRCSSSNESANKLFIEATRLLQESFAQEFSDPEAAVVASKKALNEIEKITRSYPSSDLAVKLVQGQTVFNELSVEAFQDRQKKLQATAKVVHDATKSPQGLAVWLAGHYPQLAFRYFVDIGDTTQALQVANTIQEDSVKAVALEVIATALAKAGDTKQAVQLANTIQGNFYKTDASVDIATALAKAGDTTQAQAVFTQALQLANTIQGDFHKAVALGNIATALARAGDTTQALQVANTISKDFGKARALVDIATALAEAGDTTQALQVANTIQEDSDKVWALRDIATALAEAGDTTQAQAVFTQALQVANSLSKDSVKAWALGNVNDRVKSAGLLLFETSSEGQHVPIKKFSKEQLRLARMSIVASLTAERLIRKAHSKRS
jgi:tetratricopeptide (TPR) repeat protein